MATPGELYGRPWAEPEYVIVLHEYFLHRNEAHDADCDYVVSTAQLLGRTPAAVAMRLENYASIDPALSGKRAGLSHMNAVGRRLFNFWVTRLASLADCAATLTRDLQARSAPSLFEPYPIKIPRAFAHYELVDQIGAGGCGTVFSCIDVETQERFAIKIISTDRVHDDEALHRFRREIRVLKSREHANVIRLHEDNLDTERDFPAFVMDFATHSLTTYAEEIGRDSTARQRPVLCAAEARRILASVFNAVHGLHTDNPRIMHRDINPNNILRLPDGAWVLADFGLAKFISSAPLMTSFRTSTQHGQGTMWYTAPEQYHNFLDVDERTDIYSLGVLIWELFTTGHQPPDPENLGLSDALASVYRKATRRDPKQRYQTVQELRQAFEESF